MRISCTQELHLVGGPGDFYLGRSEALLPSFLDQYAGKVQMIYLDPPFGTGDTFHVRINADRRTVSLPAFSDTLSQQDYLSWMRIILSGCRELLSDTGSLYLHVDYRMSARLRILMDEIFGQSNFMNELIWSYQSGGRSKNYFPRKHDTILFYRRSRKVYFDLAAVGIPRGRERRNHLKRVVDEKGRVGYSIRSSGKTYTYYEDTPVYPTDVWTDIEHLQQRDSQRTGYATQKPEALLSRIISVSSRPGDLVADLFSGSGTTAAAAQKLGRRFLVADASPFALYTLRARLLKTAGTPSLFAGSQSLSLRFHACEEPASLDAALIKQDGHPYVEIRSAGFGGDCPLVYAAVGSVEKGCFHPLNPALSPRLPLRLPIGSLKQPVVEITDALGKQAFFTV